MAAGFNFPYFNKGDRRIILQGNAEILPPKNGVLALTSHVNPAWNTGRALYAEQIPIWNSTGNVASFVTSFSFVVTDIDPNYYPGDGIVFFLAPHIAIPYNSSGGRLGIVDGNNAYNRFVAVEFDSFVDRCWDPDYAHIGIDVNSLISLKTVQWNRVSGSTVNVNIIYDSPTKTLSVDVNDEPTVTQVVDLKAVLPEKVWIGFSATTATGKELHDILKWSFTSTWEAA